MGHRVARGVEAFELHRFADPHHIALAQAPIHAPDAAGRARMRQHFRAGRANHSFVASGMVPVLVSVEDLRDVSSPCLLVRAQGRRCQSSGSIASASPVPGTGHQIVAIAGVVRRPDAFDHHDSVILLVS